MDAEYFFQQWLAGPLILALYVFWKVLHLAMVAIDGPHQRDRCYLRHARQCGGAQGDCTSEKNGEDLGQSTHPHLAQSDLGAWSQGIARSEAALLSCGYVPKTGAELRARVFVSR